MAKNNAEVNAEVEVKEEAAEAKAKAKKEKKWLVKVKANPNFCGIDAGSVQFAHGQAVITDARMAAWFRSHEGYEVTDAE